MSLIKRLKELVDGYHASRVIYPAIKIFSEDEIEEIFIALPRLLAVVEAAKELEVWNAEYIKRSHMEPEDESPFVIKIRKALAALDGVEE